MREFINLINKNLREVSDFDLNYGSADTVLEDIFNYMEHFEISKIVQNINSYQERDSSSIDLSSFIITPSRSDFEDADIYADLRDSLNDYMFDILSDEPFDVIDTHFNDPYITFIYDGSNRTVHIKAIDQGGASNPIERSFTA